MVRWSTEGRDFQRLDLFGAAGGIARDIADGSRCSVSLAGHAGVEGWIVDEAALEFVATVVGDLWGALSATLVYEGVDWASAGPGRAETRLPRRRCRT
jgi:hypothetical protein